MWIDPTPIVSTSPELIRNFIIYGSGFGHAIIAAAAAKGLDIAINKIAK